MVYDPKWTEWIDEMFTTGSYTFPVYAGPPFDTWVVQHPHTGEYYTVPGPEYRKYKEENPDRSFRTRYDQKT